MKLSEAIGLGRMLIRPNRGSFTLMDGEGCAVGMALAAMGETCASKGELEQYWPWTVEANAFHLISHRYWDVVHRGSTLDQLIDFVRSIEPAEEEAPVAEPALEPAEIGAKTR